MPYASLYCLIKWHCFDRGSEWHQRNWEPLTQGPPQSSWSRPRSLPWSRQWTMLRKMWVLGRDGPGCEAQLHQGLPLSEKGQLRNSLTFRQQSGGPDQSQMHVCRQVLG